MDARKRVLISEPQPELARMVEKFLAEEGYDVIPCGAGADTVAEVRERRPDAAIVDLANLSDVEVLDRMRTDHVAAQVPILVIARAKDLRDRALASYNVRKAITKPFDPEDLLSKLREILKQPPLHAEIPPESTHDGIIGMAEYLLARHSRAALVRWVMQLQEESPWKDRTDLDFRELVDVTPLVVESLVAALHYRDPLRYFEDHPDAADRVRTHGEIRHNQGLPLVSLMREYGLLRDEVWATLWSRLPRQINTADIVNLQRIVNGTMDYLAEQVVSSYANAPRPLEAKKRESALDEITSDNGILGHDDPRRRSVA